MGKFWKVVQLTPPPPEMFVFFWEIGKSRGAYFHQIKSLDWLGILRCSKTFDFIGENIKIAPSARLGFRSSAGEKNVLNSVFNATEGRFFKLFFWSKFCGKIQGTPNQEKRSAVVHTRLHPQGVGDPFVSDVDNVPGFRTQLWTHDQTSVKAKRMSFWTVIEVLRGISGTKPSVDEQER